MSIKENIEESFKLLVMNRPYSDITVVDICNSSHVSRKTFYARFENKQAVAESLFYNHVILPITGMNELLSKEHARDNQVIFYERIYQTLYDEREYYYALVGPMKGSDDTFIKIATRAIYDLNINLLSNTNKNITQQQIEYIAYFFASSQAMFMQKWIADNFIVPVNELAKLYSWLTAEFWIEYSTGDKVIQ